MRFQLQANVAHLCLDHVRLFNIWRDYDGINFSVLAEMKDLGDRQRLVNLVASPAIVNARREGARVQR